MGWNIYDQPDRHSLWKSGEKERVVSWLVRMANHVQKLTPNQLVMISMRRAPQNSPCTTPTRPVGAFFRPDVRPDGACFGGRGGPSRLYCPFGRVIRPYKASLVRRDIADVRIRGIA
jgi:hypothetical protein